MIITSLGHDGIEIILMYKWENRGWNVALVPGGDRGPVRDGMEGHENGKWKAAWIDATQAYTFLGKDPDLESETSSLARTPELL